MPDALPKSAHPGAKSALAEIYNAENKTLAVKAAHAFAEAYGARWPKAVAKITDDLDVLLAFYDYPAEHWIHLRTSQIESTQYRCRWAPMVPANAAAKKLRPARDGEESEERQSLSWSLTGCLAIA